MTVPRHPAADAGDPEVRAAGRASIIGFYALYFGSVGIILPFLPAYFRYVGVNESQIGILLALQPLMSMVTPPLWGWVADRFGRPDRVLGVIALGATLGFATLFKAREFLALCAAMGLYAFFVSAITSIIDSLALQRVALHGGSYSRLRLFGSIGFVLTSAAFGYAVDRIDERTLIAPLVLMATYTAWTLTLKARATAVPSRHPLAGLSLLRERDIALLLCCTSLHWIASAPFHGTFGIHVTDLKLPPYVIGATAALGVISEIAVMFLYPRFAERFAPRHVLFVSFVVAAVRWFGMALADSAEAMIALALLHGISFGAFYVAAVGFISRRVPATMRASGQGLMAAVTFGVGGLVGYLAAGAGYQVLRGHKLFAVAGVLEFLPAALILFVRPAPSRDPAAAPTVTTAESAER